MRELSPKTWEVTPRDIALPPRGRNAHKGDLGRVGILGGSVGLTGAPVLAARAAVRTGSGLVHVLVPDPIWPTVAAKLTCTMPWPLRADTTALDAAGGAAGISAVASGRAKGVLDKEAFAPALERLAGMDCVLLGPGLSRETGPAQVCRQLTEQLTCPLVLDADGINALSGHIDVLDSRRDRLTILTPHEGELLRLGVALDDRVETARAFAVEHHCVLVLKGHRTVTAFPDGDAFVNTTGGPGMAKGGSGDVLAGMVLSLLGQGLAPRQAVPWAVCLHGAAGDLAAAELGEYGMTPEDLIERIPLTMKRAEKEGALCADAFAH